MINVVTVEQMRRIEAEADANGLSYSAMMENAGKAAAQCVIKQLQGITSPRVTILVGNGNNGGDGLVAGRYIAQDTNAEVKLYLLKRRPEDDENFKAVLDLGLFIAYAKDDKDQRVLRQMVASADLVLDALFGIGVRLPIKGAAGKVLRMVNQAINERRSERPYEQIFEFNRSGSAKHAIPQYILAIDCPSGLDCDNGEIDSNTIHADETVTFIAAKPGLLTFPGAQAAGKLTIATIGVDPNLTSMKEADHHLITIQDANQYLPSRPLDGNKGTFGKVMVIAGSVNFIGAPALAAMAAYYAGAGLVTIGAPSPVVQTLAGHLPEPTWLLLPHDLGVIAEAAAPLVIEHLEGYHTLLMGPGWGKEATTAAFLGKLLSTTSGSQTNTPKHKRDTIGFSATHDDATEAGIEKIDLPALVLDADALNLLAKIENWWELLPPGTIITPHPGEMSRLTQLSVDDIQTNRTQIAQEQSRKWKVIVVLKGAHTVIAAPDKDICILPFKTDALSTAGTGDVLAGLITGMLAQGIAPYEAAVVGSYVHGLAAEIAAAEMGTTRAVIAGTVLNAISKAVAAVETAI